MRYGNELREALKSGRAIGGHVFLGDPAISEALAIYGYDFIWIDAEHGAFDRPLILSHVIAANAGGAAAVVRVPSWSMEAVKPVLEMGIDGIIIPQTKGYEDAKAALAECLYPPRGVRGFGPRRAIRYNDLDTGEYLRNAEDEIVRIIQIEHHKAVEEIDRTLTLDGLDALVLGPNDLASSIGLIGEALHPKVLDLSQHAIAQAKKAGVPIGVSIGPNQEAIDIWRGLGVDYFSCGDDISFLHQGAKATIEAIQKGQRRE